MSWVRAGAAVISAWLAPQLAPAGGPSPPAGFHAFPWDSQDRMPRAGCADCATLQHVSAMCSAKCRGSPLKPHNVQHVLSALLITCAGGGGAAGGARCHSDDAGNAPRTRVPKAEQLHSSLAVGVRRKPDDMSYLCRSWSGGGRGATPSRRRWRRRCRRSRSGPLVGCSPSARCASPSSPRRPSRRCVYLIYFSPTFASCSTNKPSCEDRLQSFRTLRLTFEPAAPLGAMTHRAAHSFQLPHQNRPCFAQVQVSLLRGI